jgi:hypothetical protein
MLVGNTTRRNQETLAVSLGRIIDKYRVPADVNSSQVDFNSTSAWKISLGSDLIKNGN